MTTQFIEEDGKRKFAVIPIDLYERMLDALDDREAVRAYDAFKADPQEMLPAEMVDRIIDGENRVKVWREHRGLTQQALADKAGLSKPYVSQIEASKRLPSARAYRSLADALEIEVADLL